MRSGRRAGSLLSWVRARPSSTCRTSGCARSCVVAASALRGSRPSWLSSSTGWRSTTALAAPLSPARCIPASAWAALSSPSC
eukprot:3869036-Alexandrium_andersonii.AAC.1